MAIDSTISSSYYKCVPSCDYVDGSFAQGRYCLKECSTTTPYTGSDNVCYETCKDNPIGEIF